MHPVAVWRLGEAWRAGHEARKRGRRPQKTIRDLRFLPDAYQRLLAERLAACAAVLEDLARQRDVDGADLLARIALNAERVGQVGRVEPMVERRQDQTDRSVVDVAELVAAHRHERWACVGTSAAPDACQGVAKDRVVEHLLAAVVEDHTVHLARPVHADGQGLLDVGRARWTGDPVDVAGHDLAGAAARQHAQHRNRVVQRCHQLVDAEQRDVDRRQCRREVSVAFVGDQHDGACLGDGHVRAGDAYRRIDELLAERIARVLLDRLDRRLCAEHLGGVFFGQVDRRRYEMRRMGVRELHHPLAEVGLDNFDAESLEVRVELDLLARHRLDLGHHHASSGRQTAARVPAELTDDIARLRRVLREMHCASDGGKAFCELLEQLWKSVEVGLASTLQISPALREVEALESGVAAAAQTDHGAHQSLLQTWVV